MGIDASFLRLPARLSGIVIDQNFDMHDTVTPAILHTVNARYIDGSPPAPAAPDADFSGDPLSGTAPLEVQFTDLSLNTPTSWSWDFGDGETSIDQNPIHTYNNAGTYDVSLTAENIKGSDTLVRTGYIAVSAPDLWCPSLTCGYGAASPFTMNPTQEPPNCPGVEMNPIFSSGGNLYSHDWYYYPAGVNNRLYMAKHLISDNSIIYDVLTGGFQNLLGTVRGAALGTSRGAAFIESDHVYVSYFWDAATGAFLGWTYLPYTASFILLLGGVPDPDAGTLLVAWTGFADLDHFNIDLWTGVVPGGTPHLSSRTTFLYTEAGLNPPQNIGVRSGGAAKVGSHYYFVQGVLPSDFPTHPCRYRVLHTSDLSSWDAKCLTLPDDYPAGRLDCVLYGNGGASIAYPTATPYVNNLRSLVY